MIGKSLGVMDGEDVLMITATEFVGKLFQSKNQFLRVVWQSNQNKRLKKTGEGAEFKTKEVRKLYVATVRNGFNFKNRVIELLKQRGASHEALGWKPQERSWGDHVPGTPFVIHQNEGDDQLLRLHGHFLIAPNRKTGKPVYHNVEGRTGYYVDGVKADKELDKKIAGLQYERKAPMTALDQARFDCHPVNARLDDIVVVKLGGKWYSITPPDANEIQTLALKADEYGNTVLAEAAKKQAEQERKAA